MTERKRQGMTLVEILIASIVLMALVLIVYRLLFTAQESSARTNLNSVLKSRCKAVVEGWLREFTEARILDVSLDNDEIEYQVPVDHDSDNDVLDDAGEPEWGMSDSAAAGQLDWIARYEFVKESEVDESSEGIDVNNDGDQDDEFDVGRIERIIVKNNGQTHSTVIINHDVFLKHLDHDGDLTGDDVDDPLFLLKDASGAEVDSNGSVLILNLWLGRRGPGPDYYLHNSMVEVDLRNPQN